jgi:hypothetical protein
VIEDQHAADAVHRLEARERAAEQRHSFETAVQRFCREGAEQALRATLDRLTAQEKAHAAELDDPAAFTVAPPPVEERAQCERCEQPIARYGQHWRHEGGTPATCPRACPPERST